MQSTILMIVLPFARASMAMCAAGLALLAIGLVAAKNDIAHARGIDKSVALAPLCFAIPLAIFGAEHLSLPEALLPLVPSYMPWRMFWVYFVGCALIASSLSIATKQKLRWSGTLLGGMMFLFVAMLHLPGAISDGGRILWTIVLRELSFGGAAWVLAGVAMGGQRVGTGNHLITLGRVAIASAAIFFGVEHILHPLGLPGVPLAKPMPTWIPVRAVIDYVTGAFLMAAGACFLLGRKPHIAAKYLGAWLLFLVVAVYGPVLIGALGDPSTAAQVEGINYFADTLLFAGTILSLAGVRQKQPLAPVT